MHFNHVFVDLTNRVFGGNCFLDPICMNIVCVVVWSSYCVWSHIILRSDCSYTIIKLQVKLM